MLGIDTSCDDTSCALIFKGRQVLSNIVSSQTSFHREYGGVVPEIASRRHLEMMVPVLETALGTAGVTKKDIQGVAVTNGPGLLGSLLVGVCFGKSLSTGLKIPVVGVQHLEGHIMANFLGDNEPLFPLLNLVVSGGHSDVILMERFGSYEIIGQTRDDAAGEAFDKVAREIGLPFPGGPHLDEIAEQGDPQSFFFPHPKIKGNLYDYSFSGLKTRALQHFEACGKSPRCVADISASFRQAIVRELLYHIETLIAETGARAFAISGGVASNSLLRTQAEALCNHLDIPLFIPDKQFCTDNGAMIAAAGYRHLMAGFSHGPHLNAVSNLPLSSW